MRTCDLHIHSTASDGMDAPEDLPRLAKEAGLAALALTDHDTMAGLAACARAAKKIGIDFVPGIELSADPASVGRNETAEGSTRGTLHVLGYFIAYEGPAAAQFQVIEKRLLKAREQRNPEMIEKLNELGVNITYDEVIEAAGGTIVGRPHIAQVMMRKGYVKSIHEAFARYIGQDGAAYLRKDRLSAQEAIEAIHDAGGLACLAHPLQLGLRQPGELEHVVMRLKDMGLDAIETRHSDHGVGDIERFEKFAARCDLLTSGGSDYHGSRKAIGMGSQQVPYDVYQALYRRWRAGSASGRG